MVFSRFPRIIFRSRQKESNDPPRFPLIINRDNWGLKAPDGDTCEAGRGESFPDGIKGEETPGGGYRRSREGRVPGGDGRGERVIGII